MSTQKSKTSKLNVPELLKAKYLWITPVVVGFVLRLFDLTRSSIWHDEGYTMWLIRGGFADIVARTARDVHPPAYYILAKFWTLAFGNSVFSIRFLSLLFSVGIIYLVYRIVAEIWDLKAAFWASLLVAFSPFLIRFGQEARMYGVVAFFTTLAAYFVVMLIKTKKDKYIWLYIPAMIIAMYTQYYAFFVVISLWLVMAIFTPEFWTLQWLEALKEKKGVFNYKWWIANISLLVLYAPWFPVAYKQVTRVGGSYWIKPEWITIRTIPNNVLQFVTYSHLDAIYSWNIFGVAGYWFIALALILSGAYLFTVKDKKRVVASLFVYGFLPMVLVFVLSKLKTPIYQDRYFPFSALGVFAIWGILISLIKQTWLRISIGIVALAVLSYGIYFMHTDVNHQMKQVSDEVKAKEQDGDSLLSGSLYTFLDGSYYFGYGNIVFLSKPVDGFGESSLFYDQQDKYVLDPSKVGTLGQRVWVIGRPGEDYTNNNDLAGWTVYDKIEKGSVTATLYTR